MDFDTAEDLGLVEPDGFGAVQAGTAYALFRHGQDRQTQQLLRGLARQQSVRTHVPTSHDIERAEATPVINVQDYIKPPPPGEAMDAFNDYVGQQPMKNQLKIHMDAAKAQGRPLPHTLFASGYPGVGKTEAARRCAKYMGARMVELMPPFNAYTLAEAIYQLNDGDFLFLDEIHRLAESGKRGAEILLKPLEENVLFLPDGTVVQMPRITILGATTDRDMLPEPVVDRFKIKPYFQPYSLNELTKIAVRFAWRHGALDDVDNSLAATMARACRGVPRVLEEMVFAARDMTHALGQPPSPTDLLTFLEVEPDGLTRTHIHYITALRLYFPRKTKDEGTEYIIGEAAIQQILRETKAGLGRIERFLVEMGLLDRTPRGRRLTQKGILRAEACIRAGKGASHA